MAALDPISKELIAFDKALPQEDLGVYFSFLLLANLTWTLLDLIYPMTDEQIEWAQDYADEFIYEA
jgi:hypothetical protein